MAAAKGWKSSLTPALLVVRPPRQIALAFCNVSVTRHAIEFIHRPLGTVFGCTCQLLHECTLVISLEL